MHSARSSKKFIRYKAKNYDNCIKGRVERESIYASKRTATSQYKKTWKK